MATEEDSVGARLAGDGPHVTAETPTAKWYPGEEMDWEYATRAVQMLILAAADRAACDPQRSPANKLRKRGLSCYYAV